VIRFGLRNTLQTLRDGQLDNLLDWNVMLDWRLTPGQDRTNLDEPFSQQETFSDLYSDLTFKPRSWIVLDSQLRYDINGGDLNLAFHQLTLTPNERWSWASATGICAADLMASRKPTISSPARFFTG